MNKIKDKIDAEKYVYDFLHSEGFDDFQAYYNSSSHTWEVSNHDQAERISDLMTKKWHEIGGDDLPTC